MLDLQHLKTFMMVATTKSFSRAGIELGYSQATVTYHIQTLERELGARLLNRFYTKKIVLTDVGSRIYEYARQLLALAEEAKAAARPKEKSAGPKRGTADKEAPGDVVRTPW